MWLSIVSVVNCIAVFVYHAFPTSAALLTGELTGATIWIDLLAITFPKLCRLGNERNSPDS